MGRREIRREERVEIHGAQSYSVNGSGDGVSITSRRKLNHPKSAQLQLCRNLTL
jgi:hypothetical protein